MKSYRGIKRILFVAGTLCMSQAFACDICGCGVGGNYIGILPEFNQKIVGLRYRYNSLRSHAKGGTVTYLTTDENYRTAELWAGWNINRRFRVMVSLPYQLNEKVNQGTRLTKNGIGDVSFTNVYQMFAKRLVTDRNQVLVHSIWLGGGIKLPTGTYDPLNKAPLADNNNLFQLGTGSLDFFLTTMYDIRLQDAGLNTTVNYKINTANRYGYRYGNKLTGTVQAYYKLRLLKRLAIAPNTGIQWEQAGLDKDAGYAVDVSGGQILNATLGAELSAGGIMVGVNWQTPLSQHLAGDFVRANNRLMLHLSVNL